MIMMIIIITIINYPPSNSWLISAETVSNLNYQTIEL